LGGKGNSTQRRRGFAEFAEGKGRREKEKERASENFPLFSSLCSLSSL
jgi:hypothetical protein